MTATRVPAERIAIEDVVKNSVRNLRIACNATNPTYQVDISADAVVGADDGSQFITVGSNLTLDIATIGANGLDAGVEAINTWYYIWLILNPTTGAVAGLLSASATAPTLPAGYTKKRLVGAVRNDGASNFRKFSQVDKESFYQGELGVFSSAAPSAWTQIDFSAAVPAVSRRARIRTSSRQTNNNVLNLYYRHDAPSGGTGGDSVMIGHAPGGAAFNLVDFIKEDMLIVMSPSRLGSIIGDNTSTLASLFIHGFVLDL
jgi:hypothetical protein